MLGWRNAVQGVEALYTLRDGVCRQGWQCIIVGSRIYGVLGTYVNMWRCMDGSQVIRLSQGR